MLFDNQTLRKLILQTENCPTIEDYTASEAVLGIIQAYVPEGTTDPFQIPENVLDELERIYTISTTPIQEVRMETGMTQKQFAARFAVAKRTVENWEYVSCPLYVRWMIAECLGKVKR